MYSTDTLAPEPCSEREWIRIIAERGETKIFAPRTIIIHEGDFGDAIYLIREGRGKIYSTNEAGKAIVFALYGPGDVLGEPTIDGGARSASVMTLEKTTCSVIRAPEFRKMIASNPDLALRVIFNLIRVLRSSNEHLKSLALEDVYGRVVRLLMNNADEVGGEWVVRERMTQQSIADRVGSSREMVSRILKDLERGHYLSTDKGAIRIHRKPPPGW